MTKETRKSAKNRHKGIKDIDKILDDPESYARDVSVKRLVSILQKMSDQYYAGKDPYVDDETFDIMVDILEERDPDNAFLFQTGITEPTIKDRQLPFSMPSLSKIKPGEKSLQRWFSRYKGSYIVMDKLDGISAQIYKDSNGNVDLFTKKQTDMGTSKKHLLKFLVNDYVLDLLPKDTSVRGEIVISKKDFEEVQKIDKNLKNPRSAMAGLVNTDKIDIRLAGKAQLVTYNILHPRYTISEQLTTLKKWGFSVVWNKNFDMNEEHDGSDDNINEIELKLKHILKERREESEYLVDGIVLADDSKTYLHSKEMPKHAMAFKMNIAINMKEVKVEEVIWEPTMYGYLQPTIRIKPTVVPGNVTITYVTGHNAKFIKDNKIGKEAIIKIVRSGDVIPYIVEVVKHAKKTDMPDVKYMWTDSLVDIYAVDPSTDIERKINIKKNLHFFRTLGVKYLSEGIMTKIYDAGYETIYEICIAADEKDTELYEIGGLGEKIVNKIYNQIDNAMINAKLPEFMAGSLKFGRGIGVRKIREIIKLYPNILDMYTKGEQNIKELILNVPGFSETMASKFADDSKLEEFMEFLTELRDNTSYKLTFKTAKKNDDIAHDMTNEKVVLTGFRSNDIADFIEKNGGTITSTVSKNTTLVIYADATKNSSKLTKARKLGITTMLKKDFENKYDIKSEG